MNPKLPKYSFHIGVLAVNLLLALYAVPITDFGDSGVYIKFSRALLGEPSGLNLAHRSPLYPIVLAGFMQLLGDGVVFKFMLYFQYLLLASTTIMLFYLFVRIMPERWLAMLAALLFNLSLSTIFYANIMLTEILTVFLLVASLLVLFKVYEKGRQAACLLLGATVGLLMLARFNTVPLILTYLILLGAALHLRRQPVRQWIIGMGSFLLPLLLLLNAWSYYNYTHNGFYGLFPRSGQGVPRNITVSSIHAGNTVSAANQPVLDIFLEAKEEYRANLPPKRKGSLSSLDRFDVVSNLYGGYKIYSLAKPKLQSHFNLPASSGEHELSQKLSGFYQEIASQNQGFITLYRFFSFFSSFRVSASGTLPAEYGAINLNVLPAFVFMGFKLGFVFCSFCVFLAFFFFAWATVRKGWKVNFYLLALFFIIFSFWGINFVFVTAADANRYKYPADPLVMGVFVFYAAQATLWLRARKKKRSYANALLGKQGIRQ
jgi:4-amino-4-deoxy-L-arabinose transferase-like glycosyltransferase